MQKKIDSKETNNKLSKYEVLDTGFYKEVSGVISKYRKHINNTINFDLVLANWEIGRIIDEKQSSLPRAEYGEKLITELSTQMTKDFGKGYTITNLKYMRMFYKHSKKVTHCVTN